MRPSEESRPDHGRSPTDDSGEALVRLMPSYGFARRRGVALTGVDANGVAQVVYRRDASPQALAELRRHVDRPLDLQALSAAEFEQRIQALYQADGGAALAAASAAGEAAGEDWDLDRIASDLAEPRDLLESDDDAPVIRLLNALLAQAVKAGASDIHIEPFEQRLAIRFRVDGVLNEVLSPHRSLAPMIVSRIKVMAELDIAEKRLPQDGRIALRVAGRPVDVRVSTLPSNHGERVVLRLLDKGAGRLDLAQLGMREDDRRRLTGLAERPHGILLVTGPTGSGKTTTLYALLNHLNDRSRNIMTVEDPIEYDLDGIGQTQVNSKVELSFARGLRAILRQDPDVVMVGEIRDLETARIAVQASLTGHLVLSTLHTNTAVGAVTRLRDMGIESFLLASSLLGVLSQRLVRRLEPSRTEAYSATPEELRSVGRADDEAPQLYRPDAEAALQPGAGYRGRIGIFELVSVDADLRDLIHRQAGEAELEIAARSAGPSLLEDGWQKVLAGATSLEEVLKVTREH